MAEKKKRSMEIYTGILTTLLTVGGLAGFLLSFTTNYYSYGQMNSPFVLLFLLAGIGMELFTLFAQRKFEGQIWTKFLTFAVTGLLAAAAILLIGDRVEGIGNCIVTDYDSGHGGEEAIYYSLAGAAMILVGMVINIVGSFSKENQKQNR